MEARLTNPATPETIQAIQTILKATREGGVPQKTLELVHLRVSQINGCSFCVDSGARSAKRAGETDERLFAVAAWREAPLCWLLGSSVHKFGIFGGMISLSDQTPL
jgi:AhpD family alkylhydroperoxidase